MQGQKKGNLSPGRLSDTKLNASLEGSHLLLKLAVGNRSLADLADLYFLGVGFDLIESLYTSSLANRALASSALWKFSYACSSVCF